MLDRGDDQIGFEWFDIPPRRLAQKRFSGGPGKKGADHLARHEIRKIARPSSTRTDDRGLRPVIGPAHRRIAGSLIRQILQRLLQPQRIAAMFGADSASLAEVIPHSGEVYPTSQNRPEKWNVFNSFRLFPRAVRSGCSDCSVKLAAMKGKWRKKILLSLATSGTVFLISAAYAWHLYRADPDWYGRPLSDEDRAVAANSADQKMAKLFSWASNVAAQLVQQQSGIRSNEKPPPRQQTVTLSADELNSFIQSWIAGRDLQLQKDMSAHFSDGRVGLRDGQMIVAGKSTDYSTVASIAFQPSVDDQGQFHFDLGQIAAGRLPIPKSALAKQIEQAKEILQDEISDDLTTAWISEDSLANGSAAEAGYTQMLVSGLSGLGMQPVMYLPFDVENTNRLLPVKIEAVEVDSGSITLTVGEMSAAEIDALRQQLQPK